MSNKLKKHSEGYGVVKTDLRDLVESEGGINVTPDLMRKFTEIEDNAKKITEDEFYTILSELSDEGYRLYKISKVSKGKEERGIMLCSKETIVAFAKDPEVKKESGEGEKAEESLESDS